MKRLARVLLAVALAGPGVVSGQAAPADPAAQITPGKVIRVELSGARVVGEYARLGDGRLGITRDNGATDTVAFNQIRTIAVRGRHTKAGAIVGGTAGAVFGAFMGLIVSAMCETDSCDGARPYLISIPIFAGGGTLLGAAVGAAFPKWKRVYP